MQPQCLLIICQTCAVYGWLQNSFTGMEQTSSHTIQAGYIKGAEQAGVDLTLTISSQPGTASKFTYKMVCFACL